MSTNILKYMQNPSHCSCHLPEGMRGSGGWHLREDTSSYSGKPVITAVERCPAYWAKAGREVDPADRRKLVPIQQAKQTRRVRA